MRSEFRLCLDVQIRNLDSLGFQNIQFRLSLQQKITQSNLKITHRTESVDPSARKDFLALGSTLSVRSFVRAQGVG